MTGSLTTTTLQQLSNVTTNITLATLAGMFSPFVNQGILNATVISSILNASSINFALNILNMGGQSLISPTVAEIITDILNGSNTKSFLLPQCANSNNNQNNQQNDQNGQTIPRPNLLGNYDPNYVMIVVAYLSNSQNSSLIASTVSKMPVINLKYYSS